MRVLLENGADVAAVTALTYETALDLAIKGGYEDVVGLLLERVCDFDIESGERGGMTPLHQAALSGHAGMVKLLLRKGCLRSLEARNWALLLALFLLSALFLALL